MSRRRTPAPRKPASRAFTPWQMPSRPPAGYYDPALDSSERDAKLGFTQLQEDSSLQQSRSDQDLGISGAQLDTNHQRGLADIMKQRSQLGRNQAREGENYGKNVADLARNYARLGANQAQQASKSGVGAGGALKQALVKRQENQARDQAPIDIAHNRAAEDFTTDSQNLDTATQRENEDYGFNQGQQGLGFGRGNTDRQQTVLRGGQQEQSYLGDVNAARFNQAKGYGYDPQADRNPTEHTRRGVTFRTLGKQQYLLPTGKKVGLKGLRSLYR